MSGYWFKKYMILAGFIGLIFISNFKVDVINLDHSMIMFSNEISVHIMMFAVSVLFISFMIVLFSRFYMNESSLSSFYILVAVFVFSMLLLIFSSNFFSLFLGWEGLGISSYLLILFYQNWSSLCGANYTILTNRVGDVFLIMFFSYWVYVSSFSYKFMLMLVLIAFTKSAQWPFSGWLPAAMAAPTPVSALVHSSTLVTAGIWVLVRFLSESTSLNFIFVVIGGWTMLMAGLAAFLESDVKKLVALSTLSQLGLMVMALFLGGKYVCFFHLLSHAFVKAGLFLVVGSFIHLGFSSQDWRLEGLNNNFVHYIFLFIFLLSLSGLFFMSGFFSKEVILYFSNMKLNSVFNMILILLVAAPTFGYCYKLLVALAYSNNYKLIMVNPSNSLFLAVFGLFFMGLIVGYLIIMNMKYFMPLAFSLVGIISNFLFLGIFLFAGILIFYLNSQVSTFISFFLKSESFFLKMEKMVEFIQIWQSYKMINFLLMKNYYFAVMILMFTFILFM